MYLLSYSFVQSHHICSPLLHFSQIGVGQVVANILKTEQEKRIAIGRDPVLKGTYHHATSHHPLATSPPS